MNADGDQESAEWERAWSPQKMRDRSVGWNLASDAGLLLQLRKFSETLTEKADAARRNVNGLLRDAKAVDSRINNALNSFLMLANAQFVENRVYDEEMAEEATHGTKGDEQEKSKEQRELELVPRITLALELGLKVIDQAFEKHEIVDSESEDESCRTCLPLPVLEAKDPYIHRPLPYIIGSEKFLQDEQIGLIDVSGDEEAEESEKESLSESYKSTAEKKTAALVETSDVDSISSSEWKEPASDAPRESDDWEKKDASQSDEENMFGSEALVRRKHRHSRQELVDELARELALPTSQSGGTTKPDVLQSRAVIAGHQKKVSRGASTTSSKDERAVVDETGGADFIEEDLFAQQSSLFSSETSGGLFDEENEQEDLFSELIKKEISIKSVQKEKSKPTASSPNKLKTNLSIFDDDDLFDTDACDRETDVKTKVDVTEGTSPPITPKKSLPTGAVLPFFGTAGNPLTEALKARFTAEAESEDRDDGSDSDKGKATSGLSKSSNNAPNTNGGWLEGTSGSITSSLSSASLFAEEPDTGDPFAFDASKQRAAPVDDVSLFDDDLDDGDDLFASFTSARSSQTGVFSKSTRAKSGVAPTQSNLPKTSKDHNSLDKDGAKPKTHFPKKLSLFGDDDDNEDIFSEAKSKSPLKPLGGSGGNLFEDQQFLSDKESNAAVFDIFKADTVGTPKPATGKTPMPTPRRPMESKNKDEGGETDAAEAPPQSRRLLATVAKNPLPTKNPAGPVSPFDDVDSFEVQRTDGTLANEVAPSGQRGTVNLGPEVNASLVADEKNRLLCVTKARAKIQTKRRLPTRRVRQRAKEAGSAVLDVDASASGPPAMAPSDDGDVASNIAASVDEAANEASMASVASPSTEEDDIFSLSDSLVVPVVKSHQKVADGSDLDVATSADNLKLQEADQSPAQVPPLTGSEVQFYDDARGVSRSAKSSESHAAEKRRPSKALFDDDSDSDDLFADVSSWKTKHLSSSSKTLHGGGAKSKRASSLFGNSDEDDDLDIFTGARTHAQ